MLVSNFIIDNTAFKLAISDDAIFVKGEQRATFNGIYCCSNTWRNVADTEDGANAVKVIKDGKEYELFFSYTKWRNASNELPVSDLTLVNLDGDHSPIFPFHHEN